MTWLGSQAQPQSQPEATGTWMLNALEQSWGAHSVPPTQAYRGSANPQHLSDGVLGPKLKDRKKARPSLLQSLNWAPLLTSF